METLGACETHSRFAEEESGRVGAGESNRVSLIFVTLSYDLDLRNMSLKIVTIFSSTGLKSQMDFSDKNFPMLVIDDNSGVVVNFPYIHLLNFLVFTIFLQSLVYRYSVFLTIKLIHDAFSSRNCQLNMVIA